MSVIMQAAATAPDLRWVFGATIASGGFFIVTFFAATLFPGRTKWAKPVTVISVIGLVATIVTPIVLALLFVPQGS